MIKIIKREDRFFNDAGWLKSNWLFSFGNYYDPENIQFGKLRVFNDDRIAPKQGFPLHPHREMEIVTIILEGEITHEDSMGNHETIKENELQRMSAGTGIRHAEFNQSDEELHLYQIWIFPNEEGLEPSYDQKQFDPEDWDGKLFKLATGFKGDNAPVKLNADAAIYRANLNEGQTIDFSNKNEKDILIYLRNGKLSVNGTEAGKEDQLRIRSENELDIRALERTEFLMIES